jgi:RNA polymerase sigma-70 factor (ECF subfamily)
MMNGYAQTLLPSHRPSTKLGLQFAFGSAAGSGSALLLFKPWCEAVPVSIDNSDVTFSALYQQHAPAVYRFSLCLVGDPQVAEELTSEAFFRAWTRRDTITQSTMRSYLFTIAKNVYRDQLRKSKRQVALTQDYEDTSASIAQNFERSQEYLLLHSLISQLSELDREIITLRYQEDLTHEEIADIVGMNAASVRIRAFRARQKLLQAYTEKAEK